MVTKKIKILVVDDSSFMRQIVARTLRQSGFFHIYEADDGVGAIEKFKEIQPDIVFMDLVMPGEGGMVALRQMVELGGRVVIISATGQKEIVEEALEFGAKGFFVKPFFSPEELNSKIEEALKEEE